MLGAARTSPLPRQQAGSCLVPRPSAEAVTKFDGYLQIEGQTAAGLRGQEGCECQARPDTGWEVRAAGAGLLCRALCARVCTVPAGS